MRLGSYSELCNELPSDLPKLGNVSRTLPQGEFVCVILRSCPAKKSHDFWQVTTCFVSDFSTIAVSLSPFNLMLAVG